MLKRSLALGALMAFVITGQAWAASQDLTPEEVPDKGSIFTKTDGDVTNTLTGSGSETVVLKHDYKLNTLNNKYGYSYPLRIWGSSASTTVSNLSKLIVTGDYTVGAPDQSDTEKGNRGPFYSGGNGLLTLGTSDDKIGSIETAADANAGILFNAQGGKIVVNANYVNLGGFGNAIWCQTSETNTGTNVFWGGSIEINATNSIVIAGTGTSGVVNAMNMAQNKSGSTTVNNKVVLSAANVTIDTPNAVAVRSGGYFENSRAKSEVNVIGADSVYINAKTAVLAQNGASDNSASATIHGAKINLQASEFAVKALSEGSIVIGDKNNSDVVFEKADITGNVSSTGGSSVDINLGEGGSFTGSVITGAGEADNSTTTLDMGTNSIWNVKGTSNLTTLAGTSGTVVVSEATENLVTVVTDSIETLTVATTTEDSNTEATLKALSKVVQTDTGAAVADEVQLKNAIYDNVTATVNSLGDITVNEDSKKVASANVSVNDMVAIGMMSWRAEMNDMNKRMGELRNAKGEHGVWVRMVRGESEYNSVKNQYNQYQLGYDEKLSVDKRWTVGVALSYTDAENNFAQGTGESTNKALSVYGSKLNDDGTFIDLIAKYARLENDFTVQGGQGDADYDTNAYSFSAEAGKRIQQGKGLWIEPQVELTYGKVSAVDYVTKNDVKVAQDGMESLVGRIGFSLGKDIEKGNVYARASYLYDFDGETKATLNNDAVLENDLGGGWWEVGVGANINLSKATYIYADIEKTFGGEVDTNWQWNLGVRYSF